MMTQATKYNNFTHALQENIPTIQPKPEPALRRCTVIVTAAHSEYAVFMNALRQHEWIDDSYSIIEMYHTEKRLTFIHRLNLLVVQLEDMRALKFLNLCPDKIILTGTARCFNVKKAPCDTVVAADAVLDMTRNIRYECPSLEHWLDPPSGGIERGSYFSETDVKSVFSFSILGGRGAGKNSVLMTLHHELQGGKRNVILPLVMPELLDKEESIVGWLLSAM